MDNGRRRASRHGARWGSLGVLTLFLAPWACGGQAVTTEGRSEESPGAAAGGAQVEHPEGPVPDDCIQGILGASRVLGLHLTRELEGLAFVQLGSDHVPEVVLEQVGSVCPDSGSESWCLLEGTEALTGFYFADQEKPYALVANEDGTGAALGYWQVRELLGEVDTFNEAALLAWTEGWQLSCADLWETSNGYSFWGRTPCEAEPFSVEISRTAKVSASAFCAEL